MNNNYTLLLILILVILLPMQCFTSKRATEKKDELKPLSIDIRTEMMEGQIEARMLLLERNTYIIESKQKRVKAGTALDPVYQNK